MPKGWAINNMIQPIYIEALEKEPEIMKFGKEPDFQFSTMPKFSEKTWGFQRKKLVVIGARPSNGKTALALQMCWDLSKTKNVLFMSLESDTAELIIRLFCNVNDISNDNLKKYGMEHYAPQWENFKEELKSRHLIISDNIGANWKDVMTAIEKEYSFDIVMLDYIQCVSLRGMSKLEFIEEYIKSLRTLAIQHNFCAVVLSQINRQNVEHGSLPTMVGLKNAGFLEEHCDKCLLLHWGYHYTQDESEKNNFDVIIAKNKMGTTGKTTIRYYPERYKFLDGVFEQPKEPYNVRWDD